MRPTIGRWWWLKSVAGVSQWSTREICGEKASALRLWITAPDAAVPYPGYGLSVATDEAMLYRDYVLRI